MVWRINDYPSQMRRLPPLVRAQAIQIADRLLDEHYKSDQAVSIAIAQAENWAATDHQTNTPLDYHVMPHPEGWVIRALNDTKPCLLFGSQEEALQIAQEMAKTQKSGVIIHNENGKIHARISYAYD